MVSATTQNLKEAGGKL